MFEYADNPLIRYGKHKPSDPEMVVKMINRLRLITGQNFGYDPGRHARAERSGHRRLGAVVQERRPDQVHPGREAPARAGGGEAVTPPRHAPGTLRQHSNSNPDPLFRTGIRSTTWPGPHDPASFYAERRKR